MDRHTFLLLFFYSASFLLDLILIHLFGRHILSTCYFKTFKVINLFSFSYSGRSQDYFQSTHGERASVVRRQDNLSMEGEHSMQRTTKSVAKAERAAVVKHQDNLKVTGFNNDKQSSCISKYFTYCFCFVKYILYDYSVSTSFCNSV